MSSTSRVPLLVGNKGRKPMRLPIAPKARPTNVDRVKRPTIPTATLEETVTDTREPMESQVSPERKALPAVLPTALAPIAGPRTTGGIAPGHSISALRGGNGNVVRPQTHPTNSSRSPLTSAGARSPGQSVERLAKITSKTAIPLFRPQEMRNHASPILGPRATPIPAPHGPQSEIPEPNPLLKRLTRKLDIKPHQSPRRAALHQHPPPTASPLMLSATSVDVPLALLEPKKVVERKKRGTKRRNPESENATTKNTTTTAKPTGARRSLRRKVKKEDSYKNLTDSHDDDDDGDDDAYEQNEDGEDDEDENEGGNLNLPAVGHPPVYMPARERATLWAKKVLRQQKEEETGSTVSDALVKKEHRKRSNSTSSIASLSTNGTTGSRKSRAEDRLKKEPSQMTMGELALSIPKGRRMLRHEQEENVDQHFNNPHRVRSLSMASDTANFGGSIVTPQVEIIDGKMVISESMVKLQDQPQPVPDYTDDSARRPRGARYLSSSSTPGKRWGKEETKQFYYCLSQVGPNFAMMATLFPTRKRKELKSKFKYEEKHHPGLIEIALKASTAPLDSEIVDVIGQMADKEIKKREEKRRKHKEASHDGGMYSPAAVSSTAVPTPPPEDTMDYDDEDHFGDYYRERKNSFDFAG